MCDLPDFGCGTKELHEAINREYPAYSYRGLVLEVSHDPSAYECETDHLDLFLHGKSWRDHLDAEYVEVNHDEYVLMNAMAIPAFLGAWLWDVVEKMGSSNPVLDSLIFHLAVHGGSEERGTGLWGGSFRD